MGLVLDRSLVEAFEHAKAKSFTQSFTLVGRIYLPQGLGSRRRTLRTITLVLSSENIPLLISLTAA